jgi:hypothetical protein
LARPLRLGTPRTRPIPYFAPGAVYNADRNLPQVNGHTGTDYTEVLHQNGYVTGYDLHFDGQPIGQAKAGVFSHELPPDAHQLWFAVKDTCAQMLLQSNTLGKALGSQAIGHTGGTALVEFGSGCERGPLRRRQR